MRITEVHLDEIVPRPAKRKYPVDRSSGTAAPSLLLLAVNMTGGFSGEPDLSGGFES